MHGKLVSVIVPVYNTKSYLARCLNSILEQTYKYLDVIIVDDGSDDGSEDICDSYAQKDERVRVFHQKNQGQSAARNFALDRVSGDYILFVDADDYVDRMLVEKAVSCIESSNADVVLFAHCEITAKGIVPFTHAFEKEHIRLEESSIQDIRHLILMDKISNLVWNKLYKRKIWKDIRFPLGIYYEDLFVHPDLFLGVDQFSYLPEILYYNNRINPYSTTSASNNFNAFARYGKFKAYCRHERIAKFVKDKQATDWAIEHALREAIKAMYINYYSKKTLSTEAQKELKIYLKNCWNCPTMSRMSAKNKILWWSIFNFPLFCKCYSFIRYWQENLKSR